VIKLPNRGVLRVKGEDAVPFLNNILTNDITNASTTTAIFAALLSPQGKYLFDCFVLRINETELLLDCNGPNEFAAKLNIFKLRAKVTITICDDLAVFAQLRNETGEIADAYIFKDPRLEALGNRIIATAGLETNERVTEYESHRISLGIPDLSQDLIRDKDFALEGLMDELGGIDFQKGCYIGQEMTSRMKRRGTVKQKLCRIKIASAHPISRESKWGARFACLSRFLSKNRFTLFGKRFSQQIAFDTPIVAGTSEIGRIRSNNGALGMALVRFDRWQLALTNGQELLASDVKIIIDPPEWLHFGVSE
jgi:hypothetical protein